MNLDLPTEKNPQILIKLSYRLMYLSNKIFTLKAITKFLLDLSWLSSRLAFEYSGKLFGDTFHTKSMAMSAELIELWTKKSDSLIDLGCGNGRLSRLASSYVKSVVGVDYDESLIGKAEKATTQSNVSYIVGDVCELDISADVVMLIHCLEHIEDSGELLRKLKNTTNRLIIEVPDLEQNNLNSTRIDLGCSFYSDADHCREYTFELLEIELKANGWEIKEHFRKGGGLAVLANVKK